MYFYIFQILLSTSGLGGNFFMKFRKRVSCSENFVKHLMLHWKLVYFGAAELNEV